MSTKARIESELIEATRGADLAGGMRSEPVGRGEQPAGGAPTELPLELREQLSDEVIDRLLAGARTEEEIVGPGGVLAHLTKRLVERALQAELTDHLGYEPHQEPVGAENSVSRGGRLTVVG
jgi:hypothetical protein